MFEYALAAGLTASGADAYLLHVTTTPSVSYVVRTEDFDCGIMISASHNPFNDNGIKVLNENGQKISADIEARIEELEAILKNAEVVVEDEVDLNKINVGCAVKVYDITFDEEMEFKIVGSTEANSLEGKISNESPVGHALIGKKINDVVDVETQAGVIQYKVLDIKRS